MLINIAYTTNRTNMLISLRLTSHAEVRNGQFIAKSIRKNG